MSESKRYSVALILKICVKKFQKFIHGSVQRQKLSRRVAPIQVLAMLISHFVLCIIFFPRSLTLVVCTYKTHKL